MENKNRKGVQTQTEIREEITSRIIDSLKKGLVPWRKPWTNDPNCGLPCNIINKKSYHGINVLLLECSSFQSKWWGTFKQWDEMGGRIRKGEHGTGIVFYRILEKENDDPNLKPKKIFLLRFYNVFNLDQVEGEGLNKFRPKANAVEDVRPNYEEADKVISGTKADIRFGGNMAAYTRPIGEWPNHKGGDYIMVPDRNRFPNLEEWYETQFHELVHWSEVRRNWEGTYAMGELVAEIGSTYLSRILQLPLDQTMANHTAYLESWLKEMANDPKWIFKAAAEASKATDYILHFSRSVDGYGSEEDFSTPNQENL